MQTSLAIGLNLTLKLGLHLILTRTADKSQTSNSLGYAAPSIRFLVLIPSTTLPSASNDWLLVPGSYYQVPSTSSYYQALVPAPSISPSNQAPSTSL